MTTVAAVVAAMTTVVAADVAAVAMPVTSAAQAVDLATDPVVTAAVDNPTPTSIQPGRVPTPEVPAFSTNTTAVPPGAKFLQVVLPPPCLVLHVLATSSTASHHLSLAFLVLQACTDLLPLEPHKMSPSVGVSAVIPAPPPPALHVLPASCPPLLVASDASLE